MAKAVTHFKIHGRDGKKTQDFYASLFGWAIDADNPMNYRMVSTPDGEGIGGGIAQAMNDPMVTIPPSSDVPGGPRLARFADPDGNVTGLTQVGTV